MVPLKINGSYSVMAIFPLISICPLKSGISFIIAYKSEDLPLPTVPITATN